MADKLAAELQLPNVSVLQLQELKWSTKERVWVQLVDKNPSSADVCERMKVMADDRKQARAVEKAEALPRDVIRKSEDSYRADFMKVVETELARIGAPSMLTWQRLVMEKDCNYQAMRILLTKIKSSQKRHRVNTLLPAIELKPPAFPPQPTDSTHPAHRHNRSSTAALRDLQPDVPSPPPSAGHPSRRPPTPDDGPSWNNNNDLIDDRSPSPASPAAALSKAKRLARDEGQTTRRHVSTTPPAHPNQHLPLDIIRPTQQQQHPRTAELKAALADNAALRRQMDDMIKLHNEAMAVDVKGGGVSTRRVRLLQAQNLQLQRQVDMLTEAVHLRQHAHHDLAQVVSSVMEILQTGQKQAEEAGAEVQDKHGDMWMMAVPRTLLAELKQVESRLHQATRKCNMELPLRYSADAVHDTVTLTDLHTHHASTGPEHVPELHHLRMDRLHALESALSTCVDDLDAVGHMLLQTRQHGDILAMTSRVTRGIRGVMEQVALFGSAVCHQPLGPGSKPTSEPRAQDILSLLPAKDKVLRMHIKRLISYEAGRTLQLKLMATEVATYQEVVI
ncbi:hypothetical protein, variant 5 [Aphanomyces astaci]|uniref:Uncharacterized protein n=2 Tax=Aphanomyces astaci TaxID=112090 RepID=W4FK35_APHAT|nr:hypothetical protein, variant 5 [Aphanomyces astaci]ETV67068.1 hypothetical protein, variant 5 [Aphanomyces astaci]|eukprot:XP_009843434.1 hypothetical protein, variant 5 [Aphanomyces astaci]